MKRISAMLLAMVVWSMALCADDTIEVVNIENPAVRAYMADDTYANTSSYGVSVVSTYANSGIYGENLDRPSGKVVKWTPTTDADNISEIVVTTGDYPEFTNVMTFYPAPTDTVYEIMNMIPGKEYHYKVEEVLHSGKVTVVAKGKFRTIGQVRMIWVENARNIRDIGGWPTQYGVPVKYGRLYRSASLDAIKAVGRHDFATNLNVGAELDLRSESRLKKSKLGDDKDLMVLAHQAGTKGLKGKNYVYPRDLAWIVARMREGKNVNWHCAIGCDRCGTLSFLIEGLLGVNEIDLGRDYELSSFKNHKRPRGHVSGWIKYIKTFGGEGDNLAQCFYNYWLSIGASREDMNYLITEMLGPDVLRNQNN